MPIIFDPPTEEYGLQYDPPVERLWEYYRLTHGISVLKQDDGSYARVRTPTHDQYAVAAIAYIGGHRYVVSADEAQNLTDAGYGAFLSVDESTYGDIYVSGYE